MVVTLWPALAAVACAGAWLLSVRWRLDESTRRHKAAEKTVDALLLERLGTQLETLQQQADRLEGRVVRLENKEGWK